MKRFVILLLTLLMLSVFEISETAQTKIGASSAQRNNNARPIETGRFRIYETKQIRGEENYEINRAGDGTVLIQAKIDLPFMGEEKKPSLTATLQTKPDLTPKSFETKGIRPLEVDIRTGIDKGGAGISRTDTQKNRPGRRSRRTTDGHGYLAEDYRRIA